MEILDSACFYFAWIRLSSPVSTSSYIFMKVKVNSSIPLTVIVVPNVGYGWHNVEYDSNPSFYDHKIDLPVTEVPYCQAKWSDYNFFINSNRQVCACYLKGGCGSCNGDSGGSIFQYDSQSRPVLVCVASSAVQCSSTKVPTVYIRTSAYVNDLLLSLIHIWRCRRYSLCRSRWSPYH